MHKKDHYQPVSHIIFKHQKPVPALKSIVRRVILGYSKTAVRGVVPIAATGLSYFVYGRYPGLFLFSEDRTENFDYPLVLSNQLLKERPMYEIQGKFLQIGVEMLPTAPYYLFGLSGASLLDQVMNYEKVNPEKCQSLSRELDSLSSPAQIGHKLQQFLSKLPLKNEAVPYVDQALQAILDSKGMITMEGLVELTGVSERQIRRKFKFITGLSTKYYSKVIQINHVFDLIKNNETESLHQTALDAGYYDHAHFINDFKKFIGTNPRHFLNSEHPFLKFYLGSALKG